MDINHASTQQKEDATTRARKVDVDHEALLTHWKYRANAIGIDFDAMKAKTEVKREQGGIVRDDKLTGRQAVEFSLLPNRAR